MSQQKLKFAVVGCGYIGKKHIEILSYHPKCELAAVIDTNADHSSHLKKTIPFYTSLDEYLNTSATADVFVIATPNGTHAGLAIKVLEYNKHVLIEKPVALKRSDAEKIIQSASKSNKKAMVVLQNRFSPASVWLKQLVEAKQLGKLYLVQINCFWNRDERYYKKENWHGTADLDGGSLFTQFSHFIDTLYWLFGDIKNISSRFENFNHQHLTEFEDTGMVQFEFEQGGMGSINFSTAAWDKSMESSIIIVSENGSIKVSGQYMNNIEYCHLKNDQLPQLSFTTDLSQSNHYKMIDCMIDAVLENKTTNLEEAMHSVDMIERMYAADNLQQTLN